MDKLIPDSLQAASQPNSSLLEDFVMSENVTELAVVDDLWYFIKKGGNWIAWKRLI